MQMKRLVSTLILICLGLVAPLEGQSDTDIKQIKAALRRIGHRVLAANGDSSARVLPILKEEDAFRINFEREFSFKPALLSSIVEKELERSGINAAYILEVEDCHSKEVVYSYEVFFTEKEDIIPCFGRDQPAGCYSLLISIDLLKGMNDEETTGSSFPMWLIWLLLGSILLILPSLYFYRGKKSKNSSFFSIGKYQFQPERGELVFNTLRQELTGKESELLLALYNSRNHTLKREELLQAVWGDEGDYVGRTLDVFISKLRKKLEHDPEVKIQNIRGVGYKLIF